MNDNVKHCDTCPWPLECCPEEAASGPRDIDCPRDASVWNRRLPAMELQVANGAVLQAVAESDDELVLV